MNGNTQVQNPKKDFKVPASILRTGKFLQFISGDLAAKFALKAFLTPPKFKTPEREEMMQKSAKTEIILIPSIDKEITVYTYGFSKTKILLSHGWAGRGTQLYEIADKLLENGMMVVTFDAPAHGLSAGKTTNILEYIACIEHLNEKYGPFEAAIGHSFGGICLLAALAQNSFLQKLVLLGTEGSTDRIVEDFIKKLELKPKIAKRLSAKIKSNYKVDLADYSAEEAAKKVDIPTLVIHDTDDTDVDVSSAYKLRQNLSNGLLYVTNGLGHRRILRDQKTIRKMIEFIIKGR